MCAFFLRGFPHKANNFTSDCSIYGYILYRRDPSVLATQHHTDCNNGKLFTIARGKRACIVHSIINHILYSVIKVSKYIQLKTTERLGKGILC